MDRNELLVAAEKTIAAQSLVPLACVKLARHVQRLYDPTPVDEAFATAVAADGITGTTYFYIAERERDCVTLIRWSGGFHLKCGGFSVAERATRGDVRRLCDALGIELREDA